jgi:DNA-binding XRE family transcriptional regulator
MNNILSIRKRIGLQQVDFAEAIGVSQSNVSHYENGRNDPSLDVGRQVVALARRYGHSLTLEDVFALSDVTPE